MVHPALIGGLVAGVAIATILGYIFYEQYYAQSYYERPFGSAPLPSPEDIDLDTSSVEDDDDAQDRFAKRFGLRRRRTRRKTDEDAVQEKFSHVTAMEQAMERRRLALEQDRIEIERQEQELVRRRSILSSANSSFVEPPISSLSAPTVTESPTQPVLPVAPSVLASNPFADIWSTSASSIHEPGHEVAASMYEILPREEVMIREPLLLDGSVVMEQESLEGSTIVDDVIVVNRDEESVRSPRSADSWDDMEDALSEGGRSDRTI